MVGPKNTQTRFVGIITSTIHPYACFSIKSIESQDSGVQACTSIESQMPMNDTVMYSE